MRLIKKIKPFYTDERGEMSYLLDGKKKVSSVLLITCKKGAIRANHYHKKNDHYSYMLSGKMEYISYKINSNNKKKKKKQTKIVKAGEMIYTPPMVAHAMRFLEDSVFLALSSEERGKGKYEEDLKRIKVI